MVRAHRGQLNNGAASGETGGARRSTPWPAFPFPLGERTARTRAGAALLWLVAVLRLPKTTRKAANLNRSRPPYWTARLPLVAVNRPGNLACLRL